jgi:hypothetical protein
MAIQCGKAYAWAFGPLCPSQSIVFFALPDLMLTVEGHIAVIIPLSGMHNLDMGNVLYNEVIGLLS